MSLLSVFTQIECVDIAKKVIDYFSDLRTRVIVNDYSIIPRNERIADLIRFRNGSVKIKDIHSAYIICNMDDKDLYFSVFYFFCERLKTVVQKKNITENVEAEFFLNQNEVRGLPPAIALNFYNYFTNKKVDDYEIIASEMRRFFSNNYERLDGENYCDKDLENNKPRIFHGGSKLKESQEKGWIYTITRTNIEAKTVYKLSCFSDALNQNVLDFLRVPQLVFDTSLDDVDNYSAKGYLSDCNLDSTEFTRLTKSALKNISTKDLYTVMGRYCVLSTFYKVLLKGILFLPKYKMFYIDIETPIEEKGGLFNKSEVIFAVNDFFNYLERIDYDKKKLDIIKTKIVFPFVEFHCQNEKEFISFFDKLSDNCTEYCQEHDFWFDPNQCGNTL